MAPTETKILSNYLLTAAQLPAIISLEGFVSLFPRPLQSSPQIRSLYRDLQSQRNALIDSVGEGIAAETKRGKAIRRAVIRAKQEAEYQDHDDEIEIERMLFGPASNTENPKHTLNSIIPDLENAISGIQSELERLEQEEADLLTSVQQTVGNMSDLRYGRLGNSKLPEQVLEGLENLQDTCKGE